VNYGSGSVAVYPVDSDGRLGELADHVQHTGSGPNAERQESAHSHMAGIDPVTGDVLVCDLGSDTIFTYALDGAGRLIPKERLKQAPGAGPRHLAFHPDGRHLFMTNELGGTVTALRRAGDGFATLGATATIPARARVENLPGAIRVSASGRHVLVSNRGHDSIAVFAFDPAGETLSLIGTTPTEGECPRDFIFTPDGALIIVANQDSDVLASYTFDDETGTLRFLHRAPAPTPVCLVLA
jgi:6-phosphogluconolactonase